MVGYGYRLHPTFFIKLAVGHEDTERLGTIRHQPS